jgi:flagellar biosynthetic protein FliR
MATIVFTNLTAYILVFTRLAGVIAFNPILNGRAVPARFRAITIFMLTLVMAPTLTYGTAAIELGGIEFFMALVRELFIGLLMSFVCSAFYYCMIAAGEILDVQFGFGMAKIFDPATNIQMGISGKLLNIFFMLYFFITDSHLIMFNMLFSSYDLVPLGVAEFHLVRVASFGLEVFVDTFMLAVNLTIPFVVAEFIVEVGLGILMKLIPAIHIFVINMQIKIAVAIVLLLVLAPAICNFLNSYILRMLETMQKSLEMYV